MSKMWGGRFKKKTNSLVEEFTRSIHFDKRLAEYDCLGSLAHIAVLKKAGFLSSREYKKLEGGIKAILDSIKKGSFKVDDSFEDIHTYIQDLLEKKVGRAALKLHTSRSRNDQVALDTKLYCMKNTSTALGLLSGLIKELVRLARNNLTQVIPAYTHLQHAMPVSLYDYFGAYVEMLSRDVRRLKNVLDNIRLVMGAGAVAGTVIDASKYNIKMMPSCSLSSPVNSVDTVSDRDFVIEILSALSIIGMHLSRLAEDMILWSTKEFGFIEIDEAFCTGSSLMPQKKNPDALELIRGNTGRLYGNLMSVLVMMKGLPLSYNRDMQLDKEPLFGSFEIIQKELEVMIALLPNIKFKRENIEKELQDECLYATDMADYLVQKGVAFKDAHAIIGKLVAYKLKTGKEIKKMSDEMLKSFTPLLTNRVVRGIINPRASVRSKKSVKGKKGVSRYA